MATLQEISAKDDWCSRVLDFIPPARNRGPTRGELRTRREQVGKTLGAAVLAAPEYEARSIKRRSDTLNADIDRSLAESDLTNDAATSANFTVAVSSADTILKDMVALAGEANALAKVAATRRETRERLGKEFKERLAAQGALQTAALGVVSPDKVDTDLRDAQNQVSTVLTGSDFASNTASDGAFAKSVELVQAQLDKLKPAEASNTARADSAAKKKPALDLIDGARQKQQKLAGHVAFGEIAKGMEPQLMSQRGDLLAGTDAAVAAELGIEAGRAANGKLDAITIAAAKYDELAPRIEAAVKAADATPGKGLRTQWDNAVTQAKKTCGTGGDGEAVLGAVATALGDVVTLSKNAGELRTRADALAKDYGTAQAALSADQKTKIGDVEKLKGTLTDILATAYAAAAKQVGDAETALKDAKAAAESFKATKDRLTGSAASLPNATQAKVDGPTMFAAALSKAEEERVKNHAQGQKILSGLDAGLDQFKTICETLAGLDGTLSANPEVAKSMSSGLGGIQKEITNALGSGGKLSTVATKVEKLGGVLAAWQDYHKVYPTLDLKATEPTGAAKDSVRGTTPIRENKLKAAQASAEQGDAGAVTTQMQSLKEWLDGVRKYIEGGPKTLENVEDRRLKLGPEIGALLKGAIDKAKAAALAKDYGLAGTQALTLSAVIGPAEALFKAHSAAKVELAKITGIGIKADAATDQKVDEAFAKRLADELIGLTLQAGDLDARQGRLDTLLGELRTATAARRKRIQDDVGGSALGTDKAAAAFGDDEAAGMAAKLYAEFGKDDFAKLLAQIGDGSGDAKAVTKFVKQLGAMGVSDVKMLATQLGDTGNIGKLSSPDGTAFMPQDLIVKFRDKPDLLGGLMKQGVGGDLELFKSVTGGEADRARSIADKIKPADLRSLLKDGFGDDHETIKGVIKSADNEASQVKSLSDAFPNRAELALLTKNLGGAEAGPTMKSLAQMNFNGNWAKLKDPFFKELSAIGGGDGDRLMKNAKQFKGQKAPKPAVAAHGFADVAIEHVYKRHVPDNFDFGDIKPDNTQFAENLRDDVPAICGAAVKEVRGLLDWLALPADPGNPPAPPGASENYGSSASFRQFTVTLLPPNAGLRLQVGFDPSTNKVDQIFPLSGDQYSEAQMQALKKALNK